MSNPVPQQQNASTNRPSMTLGCWITGCLFALLLPFLLCFTNFGFFITYYYVLSKFDQAFSHVESRTTIIQSVVATILFFVVSLGVGVALGFRDKSQERNKQPTSNLTTRTAIYIGNTYLIIKSAIPLVPLALSHSLRKPDLYPLAGVSAAAFLLILLALPHFIRGFWVWVISIVNLTIDAVSIGMIYYLIVWNSPVQAYLQSLPYSLETTLRFSVIAGVIAVAFGQLYGRLIKPRLHPAQNGIRRYTVLNGLELFLDLPVYFVLLGLVPTAYSLSEHNLSMAVVFAGISTLATTLAKLLASGFVAGIGQTIWKNVYDRARGRTTAGTQKARTEIVIEAEMTGVKTLPPGGVTIDAADES